MGVLIKMKIENSIKYYFKLKVVFYPLQSTSLRSYAVVNTTQNTLQTGLFTLHAVNSHINHVVIKLSGDGAVVVRCIFRISFDKPNFHSISDCAYFTINFWLKNVLFRKMYSEFHWNCFCFSFGEFIIIRYVNTVRKRCLIKIEKSDWKKVCECEERKNGNRES